MSAQNKAADAIKSMTYREMRDLATHLAAVLDRDVQIIADTLSDWADGIEPERPVTRSGAGRTPIEDGDLNEDGSLKRKVEGTPSSEIPGGIVNAKQGGPGRGDLPKAKPVEKEGAISSDDGWTILDDGAAVKRNG